VYRLGRPQSRSKYIVSLPNLASADPGIQHINVATGQRRHGAEPPEFEQEVVPTQLPPAGWPAIRSDGSSPEFAREATSAKGRNTMRQVLRTRPAKTTVTREQADPTRAG
jgi:hypothetical protein